jgi:hypothetical protein
MTFISIHSVIIYVVFFGACMRCTRLCSLKPGVTEGRQTVESNGLDSVFSPISERLGVQWTPTRLQGMRLQGHPHPTTGYPVLLEQFHRVLGRHRVTGSLKYLPQDAGKTLSCKSVRVGMCVPSFRGIVRSHLCKGKRKRKRKRITKKIKGNQCLAFLRSRWGLEVYLIFYYHAS